MTGPCSTAFMENSNRLRLLIDTDAFCKLGTADLLTDAIGVLGVDIGECGRLAALPYMLRRGRLRRAFGDDNSDNLLDLALGLLPAPQPGDDWLELLVGSHDIDAGEAQLLAASAEYGLLVMTSDKRALLGIKDVPGFPEALDGKVIVLEAILLDLYSRLGFDTIRTRVNSLIQVDRVVGICFSSPSPAVGLLSYFCDLAKQVYPLKLWKPASVQ